MSTAAGAMRVEDLLGRAARADSPIIVDVRRSADFAKDPAMIPGSFRGDPEEWGRWAIGLPAGAEILVTCVHGHAVSQSVAAGLQRMGRAARTLEGGIAGWRAAGGALVGNPLVPSLIGTQSAWITREHPKIDRIACPWLVRRFLDPRAVFLYLPPAEVADIAALSGATAYDVAGAELGHAGELCSFDAFLDRFEIRDPALARLAVIVRGADTGRPGLTPQSAGLLALSYGLAHLSDGDDHTMLEQGMLLYDALYAWCRAEQKAATAPAVTASA